MLQPAPLQVQLARLERVADPIADLIELYATPTVLFYPPTSGTKTEVQWGFSMGINIPLASYLERR